MKTSLSRFACGVSILCLFFFSSRRRHTRWPRDWSSHVCSSDLVASRRETQLAERVARRRGLVPGSLLLADDDRTFVPLAGEEHRVAGLRAPHRVAHRLATIVDD